ncbi:MAG: hypothetical protein ACREOI_14585 [bacterium]
MIGSVMLVSQRGACGGDKRQEAKGKKQKANNEQPAINFERSSTLFAICFLLFSFCFAPCPVPFALSSSRIKHHSACRLSLNDKNDSQIQPPPHKAFRTRKIYTGNGAR